ncbi:MAG: RIP metalloprotease RseP [Prevotella sp.]|nr:RIP metalloprotease RseP [Prevotella sp.]MBR6591605.1 RIP metalloprotease RseP [Prevotella sp.]
MEIFLIRVLQFMLAISLLVLLHEGGHFFFARLFKIRVEKFYLFFDPWFHLFEFKPKNSDTTYGLGWLPLGGYCKISGMIDESFDTEQMKQPAQPWEFRTKPAWQRLLVMIGGVLVNFVVALFIYAMILFTWGETYIQPKNMTYGMKFNTEAKALGFQDGDILIGTDEKEFKEFGADMYRDISEATSVNIIRDGKQMSISLPGDLNLLNMIKNVPPFVRPLMPAVVDSVIPQSPAGNIGLMKGDKIVALNGVDIDSHNTFTDEIGKLSDVLATATTTEDSLKALSATIVWERNSVLDTASVIFTKELKLGYFTKNVSGLYTPTTKEYGFFESLPAGISYGVDVLASYVDDMKYVFTAEGAKSLGGFGAIGSLFPPTWDWYLFWKMTAFLSIILAFMNILPIPALDGGHVLFLLYEMITRRKPSEKFMIWAEYFGFGILILLMVVANLNDILRWLGYI